MIYTYECTSCGYIHDENRALIDYKSQGWCRLCGKQVRKILSPNSTSGRSFLGIGIGEFNPGLGCVVKSKRHLKDILRRENLIEVGNEVVKDTSEKIRQDRWNKL